MKKLYEVTKLYYVLAEDELEAEYTDAGHGATTEVIEVNSVAAAWLDLIPFGGDDDRTCREILKEMPHPQ